ncbi:MAG: hypothetical protein NT145_00080, partial [Elusimicrobia bacterium]|nr:hypothetical protein [Elusimicrobiota bacterium]
MKKILIFIVSLLLTATVLMAVAPGTMRYQGMLRYRGQSVDGTRNVRFRITSSDGSASYWDSGNVTVTASNGAFNYQLNPAGVDWNNRPAGGYWLEISVEGQVLLPREEVLSNIYSLHAKSVDDGAISEAKLDAAAQAKLNAVGGGDNLGNHIATTTLTMSGYNITGAGIVTANKVTVSSITMTTGAATGRVLTSDASGNASWVVGSPGGYTDHGQLASTGTLTHTQLETNLSDIKVSTGALKAQIDSVAVSTGTLVKKTGDTMTGTLNVPNVSVTYGVNTSTLIVAGFRYNDGNQSVGRVLTSDVNGNASWAVSPSGVSDHNLLTSTGTKTHVQLETDVTNIGISTGALKTQINSVAVSTGALKTQIDSVAVSTGALVRKAGDTMTGTLNVPDAVVTYGVNTSTLVATGFRYNDGNQAVGRVLTSDVSGNAAWQASPAGITDHTFLTSTGTLPHTQIETNLTNIGITTGTLRTDLTSVGVATGTLRTDLTAETNNRITGDTNIGVATATLRTDLTTVGITTGTLRTDLTTEISNRSTGDTSIGIATATLRTYLT